MTMHRFRPEERLDQLVVRVTGAGADDLDEQMRQIVWDNPVAGQKFVFDGTEEVLVRDPIPFEAGDPGPEEAALRARRRLELDDEGNIILE